LSPIFFWSMGRGTGGRLVTDAGGKGSHLQKELNTRFPSTSFQKAPTPNEKGGPAAEDMSGLQSALFLAQEMGTKLARGHLLL
jgi:hypothetical protein